MGEEKGKKVTERQASEILETMRKVLDQFEALKTRAQETGAVALLEKKREVIKAERDEIQAQLDAKNEELSGVEAQISLLGGTAALAPAAPAAARGQRQPKAIEYLKMKGNGATVTTKEVMAYAEYASSGAAGAFLGRAMGWGAVHQPGGPGTPYVVKDVSKLP